MCSVPGVSTTREPTSRTEMVTSFSCPFDRRYRRNLTHHEVTQKRCINSVTIEQ